MDSDNARCMLNVISVPTVGHLGQGLQLRQYIQDASARAKMATDRFPSYIYIYIYYFFVVEWCSGPKGQNQMRCGKKIWETKEQCLLSVICVQYNERAYIYIDII